MRERTWRWANFSWGAVQWSRAWGGGKGVLPGRRLGAAPPQHPAPRAPAGMRCGEGRCPTPEQRAVRPNAPPQGAEPPVGLSLPEDSLHQNLVVFFWFREESRGMLWEHPRFAVTAYRGLQHPCCYRTTLAQRKET